MHKKVLVGLLAASVSPLLVPAQTINDQEARRARAERTRRAQEQFTQMRVWPHGYIPAGARLTALRDMERMPKAAVGAWTLIGPQPTLTLSYGSGGTRSCCPRFSRRTPCFSVC